MTALVSGASSTIGRAVALDLASQGHDLVLWGRDDPRLDEAAGAVRALGVTARIDAFDLRDRAALQRAAARAGDRLDVVVQVAGAFDFAFAEDADPDRIAEVLETGLVAVAVSTRLLLPALRNGDRSCLVFMGSGADHRAFPGNAAYVAAKHGVRGLADALRLDLAPLGIRVGLVSPGLVAAGNGLAAPEAQAHPDLLLRPEDVAAAVRFVTAFPGPGSATHVVLAPGAPLR